MQSPSLERPGFLPAINPQYQGEVDGAPHEGRAEGQPEPDVVPGAAPEGQLPGGQGVRPIAQRSPVVDPNDPDAVIENFERNRLQEEKRARDEATRRTQEQQAHQVAELQRLQATQYSRKAKSLRTRGVVLAVIALVSGAVCFFTYQALPICRHYYCPPAPPSVTLSGLLAVIAGIGALWTASHRETLGVNLLTKNHISHVSELQAQFPHVRFYQNWPAEYDTQLARLQALHSKAWGLIANMVKTQDNDQRWLQMDAALGTYCRDAQKLLQRQKTV